MARKFLYVVAGLVVLTLAASLGYRLWGSRLLAATMVPRVAYAALKPLTAKDYRDPAMWVARPDVTTGNPAIWLPNGAAPRPADAPKPAAIFFVHPTSYMAPFNIARWNMSLNDPESLQMAKGLVKGQASVFNGAGPIWAPRYRQAHIGAFFSDSPHGERALAAAYQDVAAAFAAFLSANPTGPIILAGHSQGSLHLLRLLHEQVAGKPLAKRIAAVYAAGWPISVSADIPALGLPACTARGQAGCILSWQSFAEPHDPSALIATFEKGTGFTGKPRRGTAMLCVNPLTGTQGSAAPASQNIGTLDEHDPTVPARLVPHAVPARCVDGLLLIGDAPNLGPYALPGNNYHVYDYSLFWADIRRDVQERLTTFLKTP